MSIPNNIVELEPASRQLSIAFHGMGREPHTLMQTHLELHLSPSFASLAIHSRLPFPNVSEGSSTGIDDWLKPGKILFGLWELGLGFLAVPTTGGKAFTGNVTGNVAMILKKEFHVKCFFHIQAGKMKESQKQ